MSDDSRAFLEEKARAIAGMAKAPWKHRGDGMRCATCCWYVRKEPRGLLSDKPVVEVGRCRRHAPTMSGYPVVYASDWCGDHKLDEEKV